MRVNFKDFDKRYGYVLGIPEAIFLDYIEDIEEHLDSFKDGLKWLGLKDDEITYASHEFRKFPDISRDLYNI